MKEQTHLQKMEKNVSNLITKSHTFKRAIIRGDQCLKKKTNTAL